jgi:4a-hydroxytetrahydrobiopterin dehydratase
MKNIPSLSSADIKNALASLPDWCVVKNTLQAQFVFKDFTQAFAFMTEVAKYAEQIDHHPTWSNTYNRVDISLSTHDANDTVTTHDVDLATYASRVAKSL